MKTINLILFLISITSFFSCSDKNGVVNEVSLEGQMVKMDVMGHYIYWIVLFKERS